MLQDRPVLLMALGQITAWAGMLYVFPALLLHWEGAFGWDRSEITGAITLAILLSAFAAPFGGRLIDAGFGASLMGFGAVLGAISLFSVVFVTQLWHFYLCWGLVGLSFSCCLYEPCFAIVTRCRGEKAKDAIITITVLAGFAGALSFPGAHFITETWGWQVTLSVFAAMVLLVSAPALFIAARSFEKDRPKTPVSSPTIRDEHRRLVFDPLFWVMAIAFALLAIVHGVTLHHLLAMLDQRSVNKELAVTIAAFIAPMQVTGRLIMTVFARQASNHGVALSCFVLMGLSITTLFIAGGHPSMLVLFVILFGCSYGIVSIIRPLIARDLLGQDGFGVKSGSLALVYLVGSASAPLLGSLIWQFGGYDLVLSVLIGLSLIGLLLYLLANRISSSEQD